MRNESLLHGAGGWKRVTLKTVAVLVVLSAAGVALLTAVDGESPFLDAGAGEGAEPAPLVDPSEIRLKGAFIGLPPLSWDFARQPMNAAAPPDVSTPGGGSRSWSDSQP